MRKQDMELLREWMKNGVPIAESMADFVEEVAYETEESYQAKLERLTEWLSES